MSRILIIDDEQQVRKYLRQVLEQAGYEVMDAPDGQQALALYKKSPFDLVITDILMPDYDGLEFIGELRERYPSAKVIAITGGRGANNFLQNAEILGACRILVKPFGPDRLVRVVREELESEPILNS